MDTNLDAVGKVKELIPDTRFFGGVFVEAGLLASQARALGIDARFVSGNAAKDQSFIDIVGKNAEKMYVSEPTLVNNQTFVDAYKTRYNEEPGPLSPYAYDAARLLLAAIAKAATPNRKSVLEQLQATKNFEGLSGTINFDGKGDVVKAPFEIYTIQSGQFVPYKA